MENYFPSEEIRKSFSPEFPGLGRSLGRNRELELGQNGLELLSVLITQNIIGESSRVGFGSALAVVLLVISVGPIVTFLSRTFEEPQ